MRPASQTRTAYGRAFVYSLAFHLLIFLPVLTISGGQRDKPEHEQVIVVDLSLPDGGPTTSSIPQSGRREAAMTPSRVTVQSSRRYVPSAGPRPAGLTRTSAVINDGSEEAGETAFPPGTDSVSVTAIDSDGQTPSPSEEMSPGIRSGTEGPSGPTTAVSGLTKRGPPGGEGGVNTIAATYGKECFVFIRNAIMKKLSYPALARRKGWSGTVKVSFVVHEDGTADDIRVARSSGFEILDMSSLDAVRRASPFPKPPAAVHVIMPIAYRLTDG